MQENLFDIKGKVVVITGGSGVLGSALSVYLGRQGAFLAVLARNEAKGNALVKNIKEEGGKALFHICDVTDRTSLEAARDAVVKAYGKVDVLINAAGGNMAGATIASGQTCLDLSDDALRKVIDINLMGTILPTNVFLEAMKNQSEGVIVNFSSESSLRPLTRVIGYSAAKAAINNYTRYMAAELAMKFGEGFRINAIAPGFFLTEQNLTLLTKEDGSLTVRGENIISHTPFRRFGKPEELCGTIHYLISDASRFVTGTVAIVDGGFDAYSI